jgi:hypothetical protein
MHTPRILTGLLLGAGALAALPSAASAFATCSYDQGTRTMNVRYGTGDTGMTVTNGGTLLYSQSGGFLRSCVSTAGVAATAANTDTVFVRGAPGSGPAKQTTTIDERNGDFSDSNPKLHFFVFTGTGHDRLRIVEGAGADAIHLTDGSTGPAIDLDYDGDVDIHQTTGFDSVVEVDGGNDSDFLDAGNARTFQAVLLGEGGNDGLIGTRNQDTLDGGPDSDSITATDGLVDVVNGGTGNDQATVDRNVDLLTGVERPGF